MSCGLQSNAIACLMIVLATDVNWVGSEGDTPLLAACRNGHTPTALCLIDHGAEVNTAAVTDGQTPLHLACRKGNEAVAEALIQKGADLAAMDHRGEHKFNFLSTTNVLLIQFTS